MAHYTEQAGFPAIPLKPGMRLRLRALSPTTDAEITGVSATLWAMYGRKRGLAAPLSQELPAWVPGEPDEEPGA